MSAVIVQDGRAARGVNKPLKKAWKSKAFRRQR
jgi:hypothetical protein